MSRKQSHQNEQTIRLLPWAYYAVSLVTCQIRSLLDAHAPLLDELTPRRAGRAATYMLARTLTERLLETPPALPLPMELFSEGMLTRLIAGLLRGEEEGALIKRESPLLLTHPDERALLSTIVLTHSSESEEEQKEQHEPPTAEEDHLSQVSPNVRHPDDALHVSARGNRIRGYQRSRTSTGRTSRQRWRDGSHV